MKQIIEVRREGREPSKVVVGDVLNSLDAFLPQGKRVIVITDTNVHRLYKDIINRYEYILIGTGEEIKTLDTVKKLYGELLRIEADRSCFILGFGGGIVTDIAGFTASTYMRGLSFGFIASTLLAQVDASVGGKNGVNLEGYKNMIGTFNQPDFVLCDTSVLKTLPEREFRAGLAEIIKAGIIADRGLFELFENNTYQKFYSDERLLEEAILRAVKVKADIVGRDEKESGERRKLNLGHTLGHAIEKSTRDFLHGEAVAIGLAMIADMSVSRDMLAPSQADRIKAVLRNMGLPVAPRVEGRKLAEALKADKKKEASAVNFVMMTEIGDCEICSIPFTETDKLVGGL